MDPNTTPGASTIRVSPAAAHQAVGDLIHLLGRAVTTGRIQHAAAVAELRRVDPTLSAHGARMQLEAWTTAPTRYASLPDTPPTPRTGRARAWRHEPIHFHRVAS